MDQVLQGTEKFTGVYLDDMLIHSDSWNEHLAHLKEVLSRLSNAGLTLKLEKCLFGTAECEYLGHKIGKGGISPSEGKVQAIKSLKRPQTKKDIRTFLWLLPAVYL